MIKLRMPKKKVKLTIEEPGEEPIVINGTITNIAQELDIVDGPNDGSGVRNFVDTGGRLVTFQIWYGEAEQ